MKKAGTEGGVSPARSSESSSRPQTERGNAQSTMQRKQGRGGVSEAFVVAVCPSHGESRLREQSGDVDQVVQVPLLP